MQRVVVPVVFLIACGGSTDLPSTYSFEGRSGEPSVAHTGQTLRHVLIDDMKGYLGALTADIDGGASPAPGDVYRALDFYYSFDADSGGQVPVGKDLDLPLVGGTYADIGSANLRDKVAGRDEVGQHRDWSVDFVGWEQDGVGSPAELLETWMNEVDAAAVARASGDIPKAPDGRPIRSVYVSEDGVDRLQLLEKFSRVSIAFSQGADDYLDDDEPGKGLLADHTELEEGAPYTALEHQWDEGFGYFGASADFGQREVSEIAQTVWLDTDGDGSVDLSTEYSFGHSVNAAKRDAGAPAATTFAAQAWEGLLAGRALLDATPGALSDDELDELRGHRDQAVRAWEMSLSSTSVHYINAVLQDMASFDTDAYVFEDHAKHWSELKGFALGLQFNPASPMSDADFVRLHDLIGQAPVLPTADAGARQAYAEDLREARSILGETYEFDAANLGDDDGTSGW